MRLRFLLFGLIFLGSLGCEKSKNDREWAARVAQEKLKELSSEAKNYLLESVPKDKIRNVIEARKNAKHDEHLYVTGRIGGSEVPWVQGEASFSIVDISIHACSDDHRDECLTPWDFCCALRKLRTGKVLIKFVDKDGTAIKKDARTFFRLKELQTVVIKGKANRNDKGEIFVAASGIKILDKTAMLLKKYRRQQSKTKADDLRTEN